ncbi:MAG: right-handed parallel beta-helix repeat-containing protein [Ktedonobacteraceae bacterium]|nr:right-handed parallel beta-helix repeat-containing protein [Ktedonobacteraceae bacterium]
MSVASDHYPGIAIGVYAPNTTVTGNSMSGAGPQAAGTGIFVGAGPGTVLLKDNVVTNNAYGMFTQSPSAGLQIVSNTLSGNGVGIYFFANGSGATNVLISQNTVSNGTPGIEDQGINDTISYNVVCVAAGGTPIDTSLATNPTLLGNVTSTRC